MSARNFFFFVIFLAGFTAFAQTNPELPEVGEQYRLSSGDTVSVSVFGEPELALSQRIDGQGKIVMPLLGEVILDGFTQREAEVMLEQRLIDEEFLKKPQVTIQVVGFKARTFYIFGQVRSPGTKAFPADRSKITLIEAISMAGDFNDFAKTSAVQIKRRNLQGTQIVIEVDARSLIAGSVSRSGAQSDDMMILPDDLIFVPERGPLGR